MTSDTPPIEIVLRAPIQETIENSAVKFSQECMKDLKLCWYRVKKSANDKELPNVLIKNASSTLSIEKITNITTVIDESVGSNVENLDITLRGLPDNSPHEQYRDFIYQTIENIKSSGWKHYYFPSDPRISGSQIEKIITPDGVLGQSVLSHPWLDPDYKTPLDRWLKIGSFYNWYFYNDGVYLNLKAWRHNSKENPAQTGVYLITLEFMSEREFWNDGVSNEKDRLNWKELLPARINTYHATRLKIEEEARNAGIEIDESYQDPKIHALEQ